MRAYGWLLRLYPASFRHEYGAEMQAIFARRRRDVGYAGAALVLWIEAVADVLLSAAIVHWDLLAQDLRYTRRALASNRLCVPRRDLGPVSSVADGVVRRSVVRAPDRVRQPREPAARTRHRTWS